MWAILGGLGAAVSWAITSLSSARGSRLIGSYSTLAWVMLTGLVVVLPVALAQGKPEGLDGTAVGWLVLAGLSNVGGLLLIYTGFQMGGVGVVAPISSAEGAVAAVIAVAAGESLGAGTALSLVAIVAGVVLVASAHAHVPDLDHVDPRAAIFGLAAAGAFGTGLYATGRASLDLPIAWAILPPRLFGVAWGTTAFVLVRWFEYEGRRRASLETY